MAYPLRKIPLEIEVTEIEVTPLPPALPGTPPATDEAKARSLERGSDDLSNRARSVGATLGSTVSKISDSARSGLNTVADRSKEARAKAADVAARTRDRAEDLVLEAGRRAQDVREEAFVRVQKLRRQSREFAQERPLESIVVIAGAAFVFGLAMRIWRNTRD